MANVHLKNIVKYYGKNKIIHGIDLEINDGEFMVLVGPSGCGKSTILRMISGLEEISDGIITIGDKIVNDIPASRRDLSMVFQSYALYPHMSVRKNLAFGLTNLKMPGAEIKKRVNEVAEVLQIEELLDRKPRQLSGGQKQRVAIGRAIVREPKLFLFDEPLSNLDAELRVQMRVELANLYKRLGTTMIYVTHDQVEAMTMATRIVVLNSGRIEQIGRPYELYNYPQNLFVAGFIGSPKMNLMNVTSENQEIKIPDFGAFRLPDKPESSECAFIGIRPEQFIIGKWGDVSTKGTIELVEYLGSELYIYIKLESGKDILVKAPGDSQFRSGEKIDLSINFKNAHFFDKEGLRLSIYAKNL